MSIFKGCGTALVTPFDENGLVDFEAYQKQLDFQLENDIDAVVCCGTTGEVSTLNFHEHMEVIQFTVEYIQKRIPVIAGTGSNNTKEALEMTKKAFKLGAEACLLVTPYYNKTTQKGLIEHYTAIAKSVDIPIILYNVPSRTGLNIEPSTVKTLSEIENIVGIKEASGNIQQIGEIASLCREKIDLYSGNDDHILPVLSLGGIGVISVASNVIPKQIHEMVQFYLEGNLEKSLDLQLQYFQLIQSLFIEVNPIPVKEALHLMGLDKGSYRLPLTVMEQRNKDQLIRAMKIR